MISFKVILPVTSKCPQSNLSSIVVHFKDPVPWKRTGWSDRANTYKDVGPCTLPYFRSIFSPKRNAWSMGEWPNSKFTEWPLASFMTPTSPSQMLSGTHDLDCKDKGISSILRCDKTQAFLTYGVIVTCHLGACEGQLDHPRFFTLQGLQCLTSQKLILAY